MGGRRSCTESGTAKIARITKGGVSRSIIPSPNPSFIIARRVSALAGPNFRFA